MAIASLQITTMTTPGLPGSPDTRGPFQATGGETPAAGAPACTTALVNMSGAGDYAVGGYSLTLAQLGFASTSLAASVGGPTGYSPSGVAGASLPLAAMTALHQWIRTRRRREVAALLAVVGTVLLTAGLLGA